MDKFGEMAVFLRVVEEGSFSGAGRRLLLSPSAISKCIARLEARLFERVAGTIRLTQEGQQFRQASLRVIEAMDEAERVVSGTEAEASGRLIVHTALTTAKYLLAPVLPALLERHPKLQIEFVIGIERGDFIKQGLDVAIHSGRPTELSLIARPLMRRRWAIVAAPSYLKKYGTPQTPADLLQHRCLNFTVRTHWNTWRFREAGALKTVAVPNHVSANQGELLRACALAGLGVARLVHCSVAADLQAGTLAPLLEDFREQTEDTLYVLYPRGKVQAPRVKAFLAFLDEKFGQSRI